MSSLATLRDKGQKIWKFSGGRKREQADQEKGKGPKAT